jgi:N-acetylmuramoyl-L-alanine amidase
MSATSDGSGIFTSVQRLAALLLCLSSAALAEPRRALVVVLDPGHGGAYPHDGAHGRAGLVEKDVALAVALRTKEAMEQAGVTVVLTREGDADLPLPRRSQIANEAGADLFLSIHCNSMPKLKDRLLTRGVETYFLSPDPTDSDAKLLAEIENGGPEASPAKSSDAVSGILADLALGQARNDSARLAEIVQRRMVREARISGRGVRQAPFGVLAGTRMPSALVEIGFISHPLEGRLLGKERHQKAIARALAAAVREYADEVLARRLVATPARIVLPEIVLLGRRPAPGPAPAASSVAPVAAAAAAR